MASVRFNLKTPSANKSLIIMIFNFDYFEIDRSGKKKYRFMKFSTGETIETKYWDSGAQLARVRNDYPGLSELNTYLKKLKQSIETIYRRMVNDGIEPTPESLKVALIDQLKDDIVVKSDNKFFLDFAQSFAEKVDRKTWTIKGYKTTIFHVKKYEEHTRTTLKFNDINLDFYDGFIAYLKKKKKAPNTIGKHIKNVKVFMNDALDRGLTENREHLNKRFKTLTEETESIYLNETELQTIAELDLSNNTRLDRVRDLFLIGCYTGLRFADLSQINPANIYKDDSGEFLKVKTLKTDETVILPVHWIIKKILKKYNTNLPRALSNQKMNEYLKEIGELAGINEQIKVVSTKGNLRVNKVLSKHKLISCHTSRRSFASNAFLAEIPTISIMKLTGHRTEQAFMKYIKISQEDNAKKLTHHRFFQEPLRIVKSK